MSHPRRAPYRAILILAVAVPATAACGAGLNATTSKFYAPGDGVSRVQNDIRVLNALVVASPPGGSDATISMVIANSGGQPDTIKSIDAGPAGRVEIQGAKEIPAKGALGFGGQSATSTAVVRGFSGKAGEFVSLRIELERNGTISDLRTIIAPPDGYYRGFEVTPTGSGFPSPAASPPMPVTPPAGTGGGTPVASPSPSAS